MSRVILISRAFILLFVLAAIAFSGTLQAQGNLLENPGFDEDLASWDISFSRPDSVEWTSLDASGSPLSGSALVTHGLTGSGGSLRNLTQCIPAVGSKEYTFGGQARVPAEQPVDTLAFILASTFASADCSGEPLQSSQLFSGDIENWSMLSDVLVTDSLTRSLRLGLAVAKSAGVADPASAYFDNLNVYQTEAGAYRIIDEKLSGVWYDPATSGQGVYLDISPQANVLAGGWFTWTDTRGEIDWMTLQGGFQGDVATLTIYRSSGGKFNDPAEVMTISIGIAELRFLSCTEAELSFKFDGDTEFTVIRLVRITPAFKGCAD